MHMSNGRRWFARKPGAGADRVARLPGTTGMDAMDYRLSDPAWTGRVEDHYTEHTLACPIRVWCYDPAHRACRSARCLR